MTDYADLIAKLGAAPEGGDELSALVMCATVAPAGSFVEKSRFNGAWCVYTGSDANGSARLWDKRGLPHRPEGWPVTTSVDAILALIENRLPEWTAVEIRSRNGKTRWVAELSRLDGGDEQSALGGASKLPLALCIALLTALQAQEVPA